jgi:hypothetical protein
MKLLLIIDIQNKVDNIRYVGLYSGKIAPFFSKDKPVVVNNLPMYDEIFQRYKCGKLLNQISEIPGGLISIIENYEEYSNGAGRAYEEIYDMDRSALRIAEAMV